MKILITGASGMLGQNLYYFLNKKHDLYLTGKRKKFNNFKKYFSLDFSDDKINKKKESFKNFVDPDVIIHAAALTNVDYCEKNKEEAYLVNSKSVDFLSSTFTKKKIIYISSDSVFGGLANADENSRTNPINFYGQTKKYGEEITLRSSNNIVIRTTLIGFNFLDDSAFLNWIIKKLSNNKIINLFGDVLFNPIYVKQFCFGLTKFIESDLSGVWHINGSETFSKYKFGKLLAKKLNFSTNLTHKCNVKDANFIAKRATNQTLNCNKFTNEFDIILPSLDDNINLIKEDYNKRYAKNYKVTKSLVKKSSNKLIKRKIIPYARQSISRNDIQTVTRILKSDFLTQGGLSQKLEEKICKFTSSKYSIVVNSGTSALHISCLSLGLKKGDIAWTSPISFVASANCALFAGAKIDFVDIDPNSYNISIVELKNKLLKAKKNNSLPKILIVVHLAGLPCDMHEINLLSRKYKFKIIEDASHAINAFYKGERIGNCKYSSITIFSFHAVKIITSGEGGIAITNDKHLAHKMKLLRNHGITREKNLFQYKSKNKWYYEQLLLGHNYRLTDFQAALAINQLKRINQFTKRRHYISNMYDSLLKQLPLSTPLKFDDRVSGMHLYIIQLELESISKNRAQVFSYMRKKNILVNVHYIPIHTQPYFQNLGFKWGDFPVAENYYSRALSLPMFSALKNVEVEYTVKILKEALK